MYAWWWEGGGQDLANEIYGREGLRPILCGLIGPETAGWFREELRSLDDVDGLKIRFAGIGGKVMQRLGASVTMLPGGEIFQALARGAIDPSELARAFDADMTRQIVDAIKPLGFRWVSLDLEGYRTGSLNEILTISSSPSGSTR